VIDRLHQLLKPIVLNKKKIGIRLMTKSSSGSKNPWVLKTPPGTSEYTAYKDEGLSPPALVVKVGR
jgi:hypothetical protein